MLWLTCYLVQSFYYTIIIQYFSLYIFTIFFIFLDNAIIKGKLLLNNLLTLVLEFVILITDFCINYRFNSSEYSSVSVIFNVENNIQVPFVSCIQCIYAYNIKSLVHIFMANVISFLWNMSQVSRSNISSAFPSCRSSEKLRFGYTSSFKL